MVLEADDKINFVFSSTKMFSLIFVYPKCLFHTILPPFAIDIDSPGIKLVSIVDSM